MQYNKNTLYIKFINSVNKAEAIKRPIYVFRQKRNNINLQCNVIKAQGVVSSDGSTIYQFEDKPIMDSTYLIVKKITYAEYCEMMSNTTEDPNDPEISDEEALNIIMGDIVE